jgi:pantothenate kinase
MAIMSDGGAEDVLIAEPAVLRRLAERLLARAAARAGRRWVVGIAGIPGAGKSTLAGRLMEQLGTLDATVPIAALIPMDGFHFSNEKLNQLKLRDHKGSPQTFDAEAYIDFLSQAAAPGFAGLFPVYDRTAHDPVWRDVPEQRIDATTRIIITEGNYLLLNQQPWSRLAGVLDESWWLETPAAVARRWLLARHVRGGRSAQEAEAHVRRSDDANAALVLSGSRAADLRLRWSDKVLRIDEKNC